MADWTPPDVKIGDSILWYPNADKGADGDPGVIIRIYGITVDCVIHGGAPGGNQRVGMRHVDDPAIQQNDHLKEDGGWDFSEQYKKVTRIESLLDELLTRPAPTEPPKKQEVLQKKNET